MAVMKIFARFALILSVLLPTVGAAHHSFAATFDVEVVNELEGEVTSLHWGNPHVLFELRVTDEQGREVLYEIESHSLSIMRRMGISSAAVEIGDRVKVAGHPGRRATNAMFVLNALLPSGEEIVFDPWGQPRWGTNLGTTEIWNATEEDAERAEAGIFRVWSTTLADPSTFPFPETLDLSLVNNYPLTETARATLAAFDPAPDTPTLNCAPKGMPAIMEQPYPMQFVDEGSVIRLRLEEYDTVRTIHLNASGDSVNVAPSRLGYSAGQWEGSTLVVSTSRIDWGHFDTVGIPLGRSAEIVERFIPSDDGKRLDYAMTVIDPDTFTEPVNLTKYWLALPGIEVQPYECVG